MIYRTSTPPYQLDTRKVKLLQLDKKISNTEIARLLGVSVASITRHILNNRSNQFVQEGIAKALGVSLAAIVKTRSRRAA